MVTNETQEQLEARGWDFTDEFIPDEPTVNNQDKTVDVSENGTIEVVPDSEFTGLGKVTINTEVEGAKSKWTGHADAEGLRAIGWTDDDIAYYQENGVNWDEEDDEYHKVTDDNKALYDVLTSDNISTYKARIVYLPKIDTSNVTDMSRMFSACSPLVAIPMLDTSNVTNMQAMFNNCNSLTSIPMLDTSNVTDMGSMFNYCNSLTSIPLLDTSNVKNMSGMFGYCYSLAAIPMLDTSSVTNMYGMFSGCYSLTAVPMLDTSSVTTMNSMFYNCYSLTAIPMLDTSSMASASSTSSMFGYCYSLTQANIKNVKLGYKLNYAPLLSKDSLLYIINNEAATSAITITLARYTYDKWATDPDVVTALTNHPNVSLASA